MPFRYFWATLYNNACMHHDKIDINIYIHTSMEKIDFIKTALFYIVETRFKNGWTLLSVLYNGVQMDQ